MRLFSVLRLYNKHRNKNVNLNNLPEVCAVSENARYLYVANKEDNAVSIFGYFSASECHENGRKSALRTSILSYKFEFHSPYLGSIQRIT